MDEFSNAERLTLRDWARAGVRALEERLVLGQSLVAAGSDPTVAGWGRVEDLVWAAWFGAGEGC